jgi:hypothetical protein
MRGHQQSGFTTICRRLFLILMVCTLCVTPELAPRVLGHDSGGGGGDGGGGSGGSAVPSTIRVNGKGVSVTKVNKVLQREITIEVVFEEPATHYRICENKKFDSPECAWKAIAGGAERSVVKVTYTLSEGSGIKTVYFQARRGSQLGETVALQFEVS